MNKYFLIIARYPDWRQEFFNEYIYPRSEEYCKIHGYEFIYISEGIEKIRNSYTWNKPFIINDMLQNKLKEGDVLTSFDADAIIVDKYKDFIPPEDKSFTYSIDTANTHNMGLYSLRNNEWTRNLFKLIIDEDRYLSLSNNISYHEGLNTYNKFWESLPHQASIYSLFGIKRHSEKSFFDIKNYGWNSSVDKWTAYDVESLKDNIEILPTNWNVTEVRGESSCIFYINKSTYNNVIVRHFAGPQKWRKIWLEKGKLSFHLNFLNPIRIMKNLIKSVL